MTAPIAPSVLDSVAPAGSREGLEAPASSRQGGHGDRLAFQDALGLAMASPEDDGAAAGAARKAGVPSASPGGLADALLLPEGQSDASSKAAVPSAAHAGLAGTLLRLEGQSDRRGSSPADEARSKLEQARRSRPRGRGARADAEEAVEAADKTVREALAGAAQNARQASSLPLAGTPAPAPPSRRGRARGEGDDAQSVNGTARATLHERSEAQARTGAAAQASAVKSALDAAAPIDLTATAGRKHPAVHSAGRRAERERPAEKDRDTAKGEAAAANRPEAAIPPAPEARAAAPRPASGTFSSSTSSSEEARAALPPSPGSDVRGALLPHAAHLKIEAGAMGALELHLRVREGALHLRVEGDAARAVEARSGELSRALAGEGLKLAPIETAPRDAMSRDGGTPQGDGGGGGRSFEERREAWNEAAENGGRDPAPSPRSSQPWPASSGSSAVHVKA